MIADDCVCSWKGIGRDIILYLYLEITGIVKMTIKKQTVTFSLL